MNAVVKARPASVRDRVSDEEWKVRTDLAACYRLVARYGMSDLIYDHFLINPSGLRYTEITASCFYTLDLDGNVVDKPDGAFGDPHLFRKWPANVGALCA